MPGERLFDIAARFETPIREAFLSAVSQIKEQTDLEELEQQLRENGLAGATAFFQNLQVNQVFTAAMAIPLQEAISASGRLAFSFIPGPAVVNEAFVFNPLVRESAEAIRNYELDLIQQVSNNTRAAVRNAVEADIISGRNPRETARTFRETIGLTPRQEQAVRNYRRALEQLDPVALQRKLRDRRFDGSVRRAINESRPLPQDQIDRAVQRYRERYIRHRSEVIARTESLRAISIGNHQANLQMIAQGSIDPEMVRRFWIFTRDERTRAAHRRIPGLNPGGVRLDQPFVTPLGPLLFPRDPNGSAQNTVQCRCTIVIRLVNPEEA